MPLSDRRVKTAKKKSQRYKISDEKGLYLLVEPNGSKKWRFKYSFLGKEKLLGLGLYPEVSLKSARENRDKFKALLAKDINPSEQRQQDRRDAKQNAENTFEAVAKIWYEAKKPEWTPQHAKKLWRRLEMHILPVVGKRPIADILAPDVLTAIRVLEAENKTETTHKILQICRSIFQFAVLEGKVKANPLAGLREVLKAHVSKNLPAITETELPVFLQKLEEITTTNQNRLAIKLLMNTFVRQGELRKAKWMEFNFEKAEWRVPAENTKNRILHIVPLSPQTLILLNELKVITGESEYLLPSQNKQKNPIMSENTINHLIHKMGYKQLMVGHGFRAVASTILNENGFSADVIERQLSHLPADKVRAAYNRAEYLPERREMMRWWSNYLQKCG